MHRVANLALELAIFLGLPVCVERALLVVGNFFYANISNIYDVYNACVLFALVALNKSFN